MVQQGRLTQWNDAKGYGYHAAIQRSTYLCSHQPVPAKKSASLSQGSSHLRVTVLSLLGLVSMVNMNRIVRAASSIGHTMIRMASTSPVGCSTTPRCISRCHSACHRHPPDPSPLRQCGFDAGLSSTPCGQVKAAFEGSVRRLSALICPIPHGVAAHGSGAVAPLDSMGRAKGRAC